MKRFLVCGLATCSVFAPAAVANGYDALCQNDLNQNNQYNKYDQNYQLNAQQNTYNTVNQVVVAPQAQATEKEKLQAQQLENAQAVAGLLILGGLGGVIVALTLQNIRLKYASVILAFAGCVEAARVDQEKKVAQQKSSNKNNLDNAVTDTNSNESKSALALEGAPKPLALEDRRELADNAAEKRKLA